MQEYRLIGYVNRQLRREDFNNDRVDAGDIGAGHSVTALYEVLLQGQGHGLIDPLRYQSPRDQHRPAPSDAQELAFLRLRYKQPDQDHSRLLEQPILRSQIHGELGQASARLRFAAAVAGFGQLLRGGRHLDDWGYAELLGLAREARGSDPQGHRGEFLQLVSLAQSLDRGRRVTQ